MKIATVRGIGVYIHWTFWVLIAMYLIPVVTRDGLSEALAAGTFILGVFACVVAHEFGHAAAAAHYGIRTADITLLPIGGVARLTRLPEKPIQELVVALAGPAVNVCIAASLFLLRTCGVAVGHGAPALGLEMDIIAQLIYANVFLCGFNLLPAFPMDGGRVLRSLLAMRTSQLRATQIAARVGRWMALLFVILAFTTQAWTLLLIAGFIFIAGTAELMSVKLREVARAQVGGSPFGSAAGNTFEYEFREGDMRAGGNGAGWYRHVWPSEHGTYHAGHVSAVPQPEDIIDAVDVREVK